MQKFRNPKVNSADRERRVPVQNPVLQNHGNDVPGPGAYAIRNYSPDKLPNYYFGRSSASNKEFKKEKSVASAGPGPGEYRGAYGSMIGPMVASNKVSAPSNKFSASGRTTKLTAVGHFPNEEKFVYTTEEQRGFIAQTIVSSLSNQQDSTKPSMPSYSLGKKPCSDVTITKDGILLHQPLPDSDNFVTGPAPDSYQYSTFTNKAPAFSFPNETRFSLAESISGPEFCNNSASSLFTQNLSRNYSAPAFSFGTDRFSLLERTLREDEKHERPGPGQYFSEKSAVGYQISSVKISSPQFSFGQATRDLDAESETNPKKSSTNNSHPGPGNYNLESPIEYKNGKAHAHTFGIRPKVTIGEQRPCTTQTVGPGGYQIHSGIGHQPVSTKTTQARCRIGKATREDVAKIMSPDSNTNFKMTTPGPGSHNERSSLGRQIVSTKKSPLVCGFGFGVKIDPASHTGIPGPGAYAVKGCVGEQQLHSTSKNAPSHAFGSSVRMPLECGLNGYVS